MKPKQMELVFVLKRGFFYLYNNVIFIFIAIKQELTNVDVLVCGLCHVGFHFVEEFQEHKVGGTCKKISAFRDQNSAVLIFLTICYLLL